MIMDKTKLQNTLYTADQTRQPDYSLNSNYVPQRSNVSHASHISQSRQTHHSSFPQRRQTMMRGDFMIFCPVCRKQYRNSEIGYHSAVHDQSYRFDFNVKVPDSLNQTQDTISTGFTYPLIQPLQFYTSQLADSAHNDNFMINQHINYDGVDRALFRQKRQIEVQTVSKPPLQYQSDRTNLYNCLDNAVNSRKGPKFSFKDIIGKNEGVTPKRELDQWEDLYTNPRNKQRRAIPRPWK